MGTLKRKKKKKERTVNRLVEKTGSYFILPVMNMYMYIKSTYPPKNLENLSAFRVADVTISLKSHLRTTTFFNIPNKTSVSSDLSCASSMTMTLEDKGKKT
jgi:hypothetical protein